MRRNIAALLLLALLAVPAGLRAEEGDPLLSVDDLLTLEDSFEVTTTVSDFSTVRENLEKAGYSFLSAELTMIPQTTNEITDPETVQKIQKMLEMLDDLDDVQDIYHNGELPEEEEEDD